jgi:hypothetical protein
MEKTPEAFGGLTRRNVKLGLAGYLAVQSCLYIMEAGANPTGAFSYTKHGQRHIVSTTEIPSYPPNACF